MREALSNCVIAPARDGTDRMMVYGTSSPDGGGPYARCVFSRTSTKSTLWTLKNVEKWGDSVRAVSYIWREPIFIPRRGAKLPQRVKRKPRKDVYAKVFILRAPFYVTRRELAWR